MKANPGFIFKSLFVLMITATAGFAVVVGVMFGFFAKNLPTIIDPKDYRPSTVTRVLSDGGKEDSLVGEFSVRRRYVVPYDKIPQVVVQAFTSAEDDKFFEHQGVNLFAIARAAIANFRAGHTVQGGSTITQQVAKSLLLTSEKSLSRKIKEVILAHQLETHLTKQQILYLYLNQIYLGHGAYGVQAAAQTYFRKDISEVDVSEAAILAGLPQAPGIYSPNLNPKKAKDRQLYVLRRMMENKHINQAQMADAAARPVRIFHDEDLNLKYSPYLIEHIRRYLVEKYGEDAVYEQGLTVRIPTTKRLMLAAHKSLQEGLRAVDKRQGYRGALKKLATMEDIEAFLKTQRKELLEKKIGYLLLMPDGRLDLNEAMKDAKIKNDLELLNTDDIYSAVVMSVDDGKKALSILVGSVKGEVPYENLKWAFAGGGISKQLSRGSVIEVKFSAMKGDKPLFALEQKPQVQGAVYSLDATTGAVLAMDGGYDYVSSEFNRAVQAQRQPGSSFKPFIYASALEKGFTPTSIIVDSPIVYEDKDTGKWKPSNFEEKFYGDTTFRQALIKSRNIPTIKILQAVQVPYVIDYAKRLGLDAQYPMDLSIALGSATVNLAQLTRVYALFPRLGAKVDPVYFTSITDRDGKVLEKKDLQSLDLARVSQVVANQNAQMAALNDSSTASSSVASTPSAKPSSSMLFHSDEQNPLDPRVAFVMTHLMKEVVNFGTGHEAKALGRAVAGKTGTTNDYLDAWFMAFTPQVVTGVWVGYDNQKTIGRSETGARAALPIWLSFMKEAVKDYPDVDFTVPPGVNFQSIDPGTGKLAPPGASYAIKEAFIEGTEPKEMSTGKDSNSRSQSEFLKEDIE